MKLASQVTKLAPHNVAVEAVPMTTETLWFGNTKVTVHSPTGVFSMTSEERSEWFERELEARNPVVLQMAEVAAAISDHLDEECP